MLSNLVLHLVQMYFTAKAAFIIRKIKWINAVLGLCLIWAACFGNPCCQT